MVGPRVIQSPGGITVLVVCLIWFTTLAYHVADAFLHPEQSLRHRSVLGTARLTVVLMVIVWVGMIMRGSNPRFLRLLWTLGLATLIVHLWLAFWLSHGWSHESAVEHVREVGGFGGGIIVSYIMGLVWLVDVAWWWLAPVDHAARSHWITGLIHGFLGFVTFNATVVFGDPDWRGIYLAACAVLLLSWVRQKAVLRR
jgi:hypothetical protein